MKTFNQLKKIILALIIIPQGVLADPVTDAINSINTEYRKERQLGISKDFVNISETTGNDAGILALGGEFYLNGTLDGKAKASELGKTRFVASPKTGVNINAFGSPFRVVEASFYAGNFKTARLSETPPPGATFMQFKGDYDIRILDGLVITNSFSTPTLQKNLGVNAKQLWETIIPVAGPLTVTLRAGTFFSKSLVFSIEAQTSAVNFQGGADLLKSNAMNEFTNVIASSAAGQLSSYYSSAITQSVQDRSVSAIGHALSSPIGEQLRFGASIGPVAEVGIWAEAFASVNVIFAGVDVGVRGALSAVSASLKGMISTSNISQYLDFIVRGTVKFLSGKLEGFWRIWAGFRVCAFGFCITATETISDGTFPIIQFEGISFQKDILIARLDLKGPSLHWCLTGNDEKCTFSYVVDPIPPVLENYYFSCPQTYMNHNFRDKIYQNSSGELTCNYYDSVTNSECAANPLASAIDVSYHAPFFGSILYKYCRQPVSGIVPKKLNINREESCPTMFGGQPLQLQSHNYIPALGFTYCSYSGSIAPVDCVNSGGTLSSTSPRVCTLSPSPEIRMSANVTMPTCPSQFLGKTLLTSKFNSAAMRLVCMYKGTVTSTTCENSGNYEVEFDTNEYLCQNIPGYTGSLTNYNFPLPANAPGIIQKVEIPPQLFPFHAQANSSP